MGYDEFPTYYSDDYPVDEECADCGCALDDDTLWVENVCDCDHHH